MLAAVEQTAGRGQLGTSWEAAAGENITCSVAFRPVFLPLERHFLLSEAVALGVKEALEGLGGGLGAFSIKWPNDIYYGDRKIAGILIENNLMERRIVQSIAGIGININQMRFDAPNPVSLRQLLGREVSVDGALEELHRCLLLWYNRLREGQLEGIAIAYNNALYRREGFYFYKEKEKAAFRAQIQSVGDDGFLYLLTEGGERRRYAFKEVAFVQGGCAG